VIFHAVFPGTLWANRAVKEAEKAADSTIILFKPDNIVFFDVFAGSSPNRKDIPKNVPELAILETTRSLLYRIVLAVSFLTQRYISSTWRQLFYCRIIDSGVIATWFVVYI